jgi:DNA-directed RNA polymerase specialized sigma24 family protein
MSRSQLRPPTAVQPPTPTEGRAADAEHAVRLRSLAERRRALEDELGRAVVDAVTAGMSQAAVSRVLGVSRQAVWDRLHRA